MEHPYNLVSVILGIISVLLAILQFGEPLFSNYRTKRLYVKNWINYIKVYIFSDISIDVVGCGPVNICADKLDKGEQESLAYKIPFKICLPANEKAANKLFKESIEFTTQSDTTLQLYNSEGKTVKNVEIDSQTIKTGYQGKFSLMIVPPSNGIVIKIMIDILLYKRPEHHKRFSWSQVIINGIETNAFETKIE